MQEVNNGRQLAVMTSRPRAREIRELARNELNDGHESVDLRAARSAGAGDSAVAPLDRSTGPRTAEGKARSARNADQGGSGVCWFEA